MDTLVYDRTAVDVAGETRKAYILASDLNRIEEWTRYLADLLHSYGYSVAVTTKTNWAVTDFPTPGELNRIRRNIDALQTGFYALPDWREIVDNNTLDFGQANVMEWDLQRIYDWLTAMASWANMRQANTIFMQAGGILNA
jgi:hypothetical protein